MEILIDTHLLYTCAQPCSLLLQIEAADEPGQTHLGHTLTFNPDVDTRKIEGEDHVGHRRWLHVTSRFDCRYQARTKVDRTPADIPTLAATPLPNLPSEVTKHLMPSRYCHPEDFFDFVPNQFAGLAGGARIQAMSDWINAHFTYDNGASNAATTASQSFAARAGVCRDYAHTLIAMARAASIPARLVSAYAPDVTPQDFHAVVEVYLQDAWHLIDPTGMAQPDEIVRIGVGRDAADVSFMTSYGWMELIKQTVQVSRAK